MVIQALRTAVFYALFLGQTVILAILMGTIAILWRRRTAAGWALGQYWARSNLFLLRWVVGIRSAVSGEGHIPPGPAILAAKHQSDWDIFAVIPHSGRPAFITKKELMDIPFFGWAARSIDAIRIDRSLGSGAIPAMLEEARAAVANGCRIIIFPEGTRKPVLAPLDYRRGIVRMYQTLGVPVVPVALDSGLYWSRNSLVMWPGTARLKFLEPIPPGLDGDVFFKRLVAAIEGESNALVLAAAEAGLSRPIGEELRGKIEALKQADVGDAA
jgi:1-acyl-sn-glycerol-3-phosphate acyltransferase